MPINNFDELVQALGNGQARFFPFGYQSATTSTSNRFYFLAASPGLHSSSAFAYSGTALTWQQLDNTSSPNIFQLPTGTIGRLAYAQIFASSSSFAPSVNYLVEIAGYYPGINLNTTTAQTLTGTPTNIGDGSGFFATLICTAAQGPSGPTITLTYTNQANQTKTSTSSSNSSNPVHGAIQRSLYLNVTAGDRGIRSVQSIAFSSATTGTAALFLIRPIIALPNFTYNIATERDFVNQIPALPVLQSNRCYGIYSFFGSSYSGTTVGNAILIIESV